MGSGASPSAEDAPIDPSRACVYLYRRGDSAKISYVGRGKTPDRALQHTEGAANAVLRELIEQGTTSSRSPGRTSRPERRHWSRRR